MTTEETLIVHALAQQLATAAHGSAGALKAAACQQLQCSNSKLHRMLALVGYTTERKTRSDKGRSNLGNAELEMIAGGLMATTRRNGKRMGSIGELTDMLRSSGNVRAERVDQSTGEITALSAQTIGRALKARALHPKQLAAPTPHVQMRYKGPNHVWQVDASVCVIFYLPEGGASLMDEKKYYKNKPAHFEKVKLQRVIRYVMADCFTHAIVVRYYLGAETQTNLLDFIIYCLAQRSHKGSAMPMHGLPEWLADDAGSANGAHTVTALLAKLDIKHHTHAVGNSRASGSVEKGQDIVETKFEYKLSFVRTDSLDELNARAEAWYHTMNASKRHTRHGHTRYGLWQTIKPDALRIAPPVAILLALPTSKMETREVRGDMTVSFALGQLKSASYDVSAVPGALVGRKVDIEVNPFEAHGSGADAVPSIRVRSVDMPGDGWTLCQPMALDEGGYRLDAPMFGEGYVSRADTEADTNRKRLNHKLYGDADARKANVAKFDKRMPAFNGAVNPFAKEEQTVVPAYLPKTGTESALNAAEITYPSVPVIELCKALKAKQGEAYDTSTYGWLMQRHTDGMVPHEDAERLLEGSAATAEATGTDDVMPAEFTGLRRIK
jgi:transposase InsO family protein